MRRPPVALALVVVALSAAACGGSGNSSDSQQTGTQASASGDAARILNSIDRSASTTPQKLKLDLSLDIKGTPANAQLALFTKQPIEIALEGVVDSAAGQSGDVNVSITLGKTALDAQIRYGADGAWIKLDDKWYALSASALSSTTGTALPNSATIGNLDASTLLTAIGDPAKIFENTSVSSESVEGIDADKVSGDFNVAELGNVAARLATAAGGTGSQTPPTAADIAQLSNVLKEAHAELWVGKSDHKVHRAVIAVDAVLDDATKKSFGFDSVALNFDVTSVDADKPDTSAPSSLGTPEEFQTAIVSLFTRVVSSGAAG